MIELREEAQLKSYFGQGTIFSTANRDISLYQPKHQNSVIISPSFSFSVCCFSINNNY